MKDKYSATWLSHSSITDYLKCPRAYFLKNMYRDPKSNHKISVMQPALALGQTVHTVVESLSTLPVEDRLKESLRVKFEKAWESVSGKKGGFTNEEEEEKYKKRGMEMMERIMANPGPILKKAVKIRQDLPYFWLSEDQNIILCGKLDWLEYMEDVDSVRIIDFKTGKFDEDPDSLQLPIYTLLANNCQTKKVYGAQYWYLNRDTEPIDVALPTEEDATKRLMDIARTVTLARKLSRFVCPHKDGCVACRPYEMVIAGKAEFIGVGGYNQDTYILS
ncbi:MAG: PD-(D/E)XK nuclease family protein [Candidatus Gottesmanbacteria bacterium]